MTKYIDVKEAAAYAGMTERTMRKKLLYGHIAGYQEQPNSPWKTTKANIDQYYERGNNGKALP